MSRQDAESFRGATGGQPAIWGKTASGLHPRRQGTVHAIASQADLNWTGPRSGLHLRNVGAMTRSGAVAAHATFSEGRRAGSEYRKPPLNAGFSHAARIGAPCVLTRKSCFAQKPQKRVVRESFIKPLAPQLRSEGWGQTAGLPHPAIPVSLPFHLFFHLRFGPTPSAGSTDQTILCIHNSS